ncbi:MAG: tetratricopeptide repeat protein [Bacteroidetes bacterium]|nr:tetratricopeptide repeat protein [Bacteroidota bacterium]
MQAEKANDTLGLGLIASSKSKCYYYLAVYDSAKIFQENAIEYFILVNENSKLTNEYIQLAKVYLKAGDTKKAGLYYGKAVEIQNKFPDSENLAWNLDVLGEIYNAQRLFDEAIVEHRKSQREFESLNNLSGFACASLHIGNSYYMKVEDDSAKKYYNLALTSYQQLGDSNGIAICYSNLSRLALEGSDYKSAIELANKSIATIRGGDYKLIETSTLQQLGDIYAELGKNDLAIYHINKAMEVARQINHKVTVMDCYKSLSEIYTTMNRPDLSYANLLMAYRLKDSIQPIAFSKQLAEMQDQLETQKSENQITLLQQANKIKSLEISEQSNQIAKRNIFILFGILVITLIAVVVYIFAQKQKLKNRVEKELAIKTTEENERLRFARDVHDDLGSGLTKINFLSELITTGKGSDTVIRENAAGISETAKSLIENMRDLIWALNPENTTLANLLASIREYASDYLEEYPATLQMNFQDMDGSMTITKESHREIFMTIKECLNNIVKHSKATRIEMDASIYNNLLFISLKDNGIGIKNDEIVMGNGLNNMRNRIESIGGIFSLENATGCGTLMSITIGLENIIKTKTSFTTFM